MTDIDPDHIDPRLFIYTSPSGQRRAAARGGEPLRCDLCLSTQPRWTYPVAPMLISGQGPIGYSDDEWYICGDCHDLIEAGDATALARHVADTQPVHCPAPPGFGYPSRIVMYAVARTNVTRFLAARTGPPTEDPPPPPPRPPAAPRRRRRRRRP